MRQIFKLIIFFFIKKNFFFDHQAQPIVKIKKKFENFKPLKKYSFGNKNRDKKFLIICRSPGAGVFSNVTFVLNYFLYARKKRMIPIIDMKNFPTIYNEKNINHNSWDYYFEKINNYKLEDVYRSKNVYFTGPKFLKGMHLDANKNEIKSFYKKIKIKKQILNEEKKLFKKFFKKKDKILGIHFRGSTYKKAKSHAFPPTTKIMINETKRILKKYKYNKIFLVTEELQYLQNIKKEFKDICFYYNFYRMNKLDSFEIYPRANHRFQLGKETIIETITLSKCKGLLYIKSNIISAAINMSKKKQNKHEIFLGTNSRNKFIARWLWYFKKILPSYIGGLRILKK